MAAVEGTPSRVKTLLTSFLQSSPVEQETSKQEAQDPSSKVSLNLCQPRSKEAFSARVETFSPFMWFAKPLELSPLYCSLYGWENVDVDILKCVSCKACIDATMPANWDPEIFAKSCKQLKDSLITGHTKLCPWPDSPCPDVFVQLPVYTQDQWKKDFLVRWHSLLSLGTNLPFLDDITYSDMDEVSDEHIDALKQLLQTTSQELISRKGLDDSKQVIKTSSLIALCGWNNRDHEVDADRCTLFCTMCRRELGLWNFKSILSSSFEEENPPGNTWRCSKFARPVSEPRVHQGPQSSLQGSESMDISQHLSSSVASTDEETEPILSFAGCKRKNKPYRNIPSLESSDTPKQSVDIDDCMDIGLKLKLCGHDDVDPATAQPHGKVSDQSTHSATPVNLTESNVKEVGHPRESLLIRRLISGHDSPFKSRLGSEGLPYRSLHSSVSDLSEKENCESLCVEIEEESLSEKLQAVDSELEFMAGQIAADKEDYAPDVKRIRLEDLEKKALNPLSEHRSWCPWVTCGIPERTQTSEAVSGWRMLLHTLLPSFYPEKLQMFTNIPPREAWKPVKLLLNECSSSFPEIISSSESQQ